MTTYSVCNIEKIHKAGTLSSKEKHNRRLVEVENADPALSDRNETLSDTRLKEDKTHMSYAEAVKDRISSLPYYEGRKPHSNQVLAYEVLLTFTRNNDIDIEKWKQLSIQWLHNTFDVAPDGKTNLLSAEFHGDELGNVHIHAIVVPIDPSGHLNAGYFTDGFHAMAAIQTSYAEALKILGIERGVYRSSASHRDIGKMYASFNSAKELPKILPSETAEQYRDRLRDELETRFAVRYREVEDHAVEVRRSTDQYANEVRGELHEEIDRELHALSGVRREREEEQAKVDALKNESESVRDEIEQLLQQMFIVRSEIEQNEKMRERAEKQEKLEKGINIIRETDPERADQMAKDYDEAVTLATECAVEADKKILENHEL